MRLGGSCGRAAPIRCWIVVLALFPILGGASAERAGASQLASGISAQLTRARRVAGEVGVHIVDLERSETVYEHQADRPLIVASNAKLVTTAAALDELGPSFFFETRVLLRGVLLGGRLSGDLAIVGAGDPNISGRHFDGDSMAVLRGWAERLSEQGVREIDGAVYLAHGFFDDQRVHADWPRDQLARWYEAPVEALSFSDNCVLVRVLPGPVPGSPGMVHVIPDLGLLRVESTVVTTGSARRHLVTVDRTPGSDTIRVSGRILRGTRPFETWVTVEDPVRYFGAALRQALEDEGIRVRGGFRIVDEVPAGRWRPAASHRSDLLTTLEVINRRSQNFFAESLLKTLGALRCDEGSWSGGVRVLVSFLERIGVSAGYRLADGSGMSRENLFSARHMTQLLTSMARHRWNREFFRSLPYSGLEEHERWRSRLAEAPYRGNVVAKTGSLRGVSTISGYARARSGKTYVFSILCNRVSSVAAGRRAQDRILRTLVDRG